MQITKIWDNLYLGSHLDAQNLALLKKIKITHILTVAAELKPMFPESFTYLYIQANDHKLFQLIKYFDSIAEFIDNAIKNKGIVFVHCKWGISRSPTSIIAYLIKYHKMNPFEARNLIKSRREFICPNPGFMEQLARYARLNGAENLDKKVQVSLDYDISKKQLHHINIDAINRVSNQSIKRTPPIHKNNHRFNTPTIKKVSDVLSSNNDKNQIENMAKVNNILQQNKYIEKPKEGKNFEVIPKVLKSTIFSVFERLPLVKSPSLAQKNPFPRISIISKTELPAPFIPSQLKSRKSKFNNSKRIISSVPIRIVKGL